MPVVFCATGIFAFEDGMMKPWTRRAIVLMVAPLACVAMAQKLHSVGEPQTTLARTELNAGMHRISAQVARTDVERQTGLMWRKAMPTNEGMLFIFDAPSMQCFWMRNTLIPLQTAFLADDGSIVNIVDMKPLDETSRTCSTKPVRYVLEMNAGWFAKRGLKAGSKLSGGPFSR
jgi:uncharacterized protein